MENRQVVIDLRHFEVVTFTEDEHEWVSLETVAGFWSVRYRDDSPMYAVILMIASEESLHSLLDHYLNLLFIASSRIPDAEFFKEFYISFSSMIDRLVAAKAEDEPQEKGDESGVDTLALLQSQMHEMIDGLEDGTPE